MKRRLIILALAVAVVIGLAIIYVSRQPTPHPMPPPSEQEIARLMDKLNRANGFQLPTPTPIVPIDLKQSVRLAIGGLGWNSNERNQDLDDLVLARLSAVKGFELVDRQSLEPVLGELSLNLSGLVRAADAVRAGKFLKVDWFLLGTEAPIDGTNTLVVRVVDARTGITRDAGVFPADESLPDLSGDIANFVRQCREDASVARPRTYLAIGTFRDLSLNNRQAAFPAQVRDYLTSAYRGTDVTLLEREAAEILFQEIRLDMAGLTQSEATNPPMLMQSAYWLVDADYQSRETTNHEVEVVLSIHRIFGHSSRQVFRGPAREELFHQIRAAIDDKIKEDSSSLIATRMSEARTEMVAGKKLAHFGPSEGFPNLNDQGMNEERTPESRRNAEQAIQAFETVLLLEPGNRRAKIDLAACLCSPAIGRVNEARNLYREILEKPAQDGWGVVAAQALEMSFEWSSPQEKAQWFAAAIRNNTNSALDAFYRKNAESAARDAAIQYQDGKSVELAKKRLMDNIQSCKDFLDGKGGILYGDYGLSEFCEAFPERATAAQAMADFLPEMESQFPELAPHLAAEVLSYQIDTNSPVVADFQKRLEWCIANPGTLYKPTAFWTDCTVGALQWLCKTRLFALAVKMMEGRRDAFYRDHIGTFGSEDQAALGYAYMGARRWNQALAIFESFSNMPVMMSTDGPWGSGWQPILTDKVADYCRNQLGLTVTNDAREFKIGKACFCLCTPSTFVAREDGIWIAIGDQLLNLDFDLKTNWTAQIPKNLDTPITTLDIGRGNVWIGTEGDGLFVYDMANRKFRRMTVADGLMMNEICSTCLTDNALWIGYGRTGTGGGIGFLDLSSHHFISFMPSLTNESSGPVYAGGNVFAEPANEPPGFPVTAIAAESSSDIWFVAAEWSLRRFRIANNLWEGFPQFVGSRSLAANGQQLFVGQLVNGLAEIRAGALGLNTFDARNEQWQSFKATDGLPSLAVSALAVDGNDLWVGGTGYIALVNPARNQVLKYAHLPAQSVDKLQVAGGYLWAQFNSHLHRTPLPE
jgi:hypothetical protein